MSGASQIRAGGGFVELFTKDAKLRKGLDAAAKRVGAFADRVTSLGLKLQGLGVAGVTGLVALSKSFADAGSKIYDASLRTGASAEALQELGYAAEQSGGSLEDVVGAIGKMQRFLADAADGSKEANTMLGRLGISIKDIISLSPDEQFEMMADVLSQIGNEAQQTDAAMTVFGKGAGALLPMLKTWATDTAAARKELRDLGLVLSKEDVQAADALGDSIGLLGRAFKGVKNVIGAALAPALTKFAGIVTKIIADVGKWVKENSALALTALKIAAGVTVAGAALVAFGVSVKLVAVTLGAVSTVLGVVGSTLTFIVSPLGLITAALVAGVTAWAMYSESGQQAVADVMSAFDEMKGEVTAALGAIGQALAAGEIGAAAKVLWALLKLEFTKGVAFLKSIWLPWKYEFIRIGTEAFYAVAKAFADPQATIQKGITELTFFFTDWGTQIANAFIAIWAEIVAGAKKAWYWVRSLFDDSIDLAAELEAANNEAWAKQNQLVKDQDAKLAKSDEDKKGRLAEIAAAESGAVKELEAQRKAALAGLGGAQDKEAKDAQDALAAARAEFAQSIEDAKAAALNAGREAAKKRGAAVGEGGPNDPLDLEKTKQSVAGTFNAAAVAGLGQNVFSRMLDEQKKQGELAKQQNRHLANIDRKIDDVGGAFAPA